MALAVVLSCARYCACTTVAATKSDASTLTVTVRKDEYEEMKKDIILLKKKMDELGVVSKSVVGGGAIASGSGGQRERPAHGGYKGEEGGRPPQGREKKQLREEAQGSGQEGARALPKMAWAATGEDELIGGDGITPSGPPQSPLKDEVMGASTALRGLPYFNLTKTVADDPDSVVEEVFKTACPAGCSDHGTCIEPEGWCKCAHGHSTPHPRRGRSTLDNIIH